MDPIFIPIVAIFMPLALVPTILVLKHRHKRREWEHLERMKAMQTQLPLAVQHAIGGGAVAAIGAGVPAISVVGAVLTTGLTVDTSHGDDAIAAYGIVWGCALLISVGAFITSFILSVMQFRARKEADASAAASAAYAATKPAFDPDAFDVVSSRC
jgi:hypothetical protein